MATYPDYSQISSFVEDANFVEVVYADNVPTIASEDKESQNIQYDLLRKYVSSISKSGVLSKPTYSINTTTNIFKINDMFIAVVNGHVVKVPSFDVLTVGLTTSGTRNDMVFLEVFLKEVNKDSVIKKYGFENGSEVVSNKILSTLIGGETSKRIQLCSRLRYVSNASDLTDVAVLAQGPNGSPQVGKVFTKETGSKVYYNTSVNGVKGALFAIPLAKLVFGTTTCDMIDLRVSSVDVYNKLTTSISQMPANKEYKIAEIDLYEANYANAFTVKVTNTTAGKSLYYSFELQKQHKNYAFTLYNYSRSFDCHSNELYKYFGAIAFRNKDIVYSSNDKGVIVLKTAPYGNYTVSDFEIEIVVDETNNPTPINIVTPVEFNATGYSYIDYSTHYHVEGNFIISELNTSGIAFTPVYESGIKRVNVMSDDTQYAILRFNTSNGLAEIPDDPIDITSWSRVLKANDIGIANGIASLDANGDVPSDQLGNVPKTVKTSRFVIGTSTAGWTSADCDYLCDGTADQVEINNAITALPATGGEIVILDGTYNITAKIDVTKNNVSIRGNGNATILKRMYDSIVEEGVITLTGRSGCKIANLQIDGNKISYTNSSKNCGIYLDSSSDNTVTGNTCNNNGTGIRLYSSSNSTITSNTCNNNNTGIHLYSSSNGTITSNACDNNSYFGIYLDSNSDSTITSNTCDNNDTGIYLTYNSDSTITGNTCNNNDTGIYLDSNSDSTITGNTCNNNGYSGIGINYSNNNTITGNTCIRGTGQASDYSSDQYTISLDGSDNNYNLISSNNCMGKAVKNGGGTGNTLVNNKFDAS